MHLYYPFPDEAAVVTASEDIYDLNVDVYDTEKSNWITLDTKTNILRHSAVFH